LKISVITVSYNAGSTIQRCIQSVLAQDYNDIEYIIIDGGSTDETLNVIETYKHCIQHFVSEPDRGIYDAMNKGIKFAKGDIVGTLNADDVFAGTDVLSCLAEVFKQGDTQIIYGNLNYINLQGNIIRKWIAGKYKKGAFNWGWMPPHPTFYCRRQLFDSYGYYELQYGTAADYELMLRFMHLNKVNAKYLNKLMVNMNTGGVSNKTFKNRLEAWSFDFKAMRINGVFFPHFALLFKPLRKFIQYI
jgi:glycosyltransferase involved in cell wall biosynthesis